MSKPKILYLVTELDVGGAEKNLFRLATGLAARGWPVEVAALSGEGEVGAWLEAEGLPVHHVHMGVKGDPRAFWRLVKLLRRVRPDILHTFLFHANIAGRLAAPFARVGAVVSSVRVAERRRRSHLWMDFLTQMLVDREVCVSQGVKCFTERRAHIRASRLVVIANPVEEAPPARGRVDVRGEIGAGAGNVLVLSVGRLDRQKGCLYLVEAAAELLRRDKRFFFAIAGEGGQRAELEAAIESAGISGSFRLLGWRGDTADLYHAADIFVLPSLWEGMPNALLEAAASGLPVVATEVEGSSEIVRDGQTGLLVPPADAPALAAALERLASDGNLARSLAEAGRARVLEAHSMGAFLSRHEALYAEIMGK